MIGILLFGIVLALLWITIRWGIRMEDLTFRVQRLEKQQQETWLLLLQEPKSARQDRSDASQASGDSEIVQRAAPMAMEASPVARGSEAIRHPLPLPMPMPAAPPAPPNLAWLRLRQLWSENWTGILGIAAVVAGATFLVINVALRLDAFQRFLLAVAAAGGLWLPSLLVGRQQRWRDLCAWMRSGGAALLLFACTASGSLPQLGLQWIHDSSSALALIAVALAVNLAMTAIARTPTIASLHVVLDLIPLAIVPQTIAPLILGSVVALAGQNLPWRRQWPAHQLLVTCAYATFHAAWFVRNHNLLDTNGHLRFSATVLAVLVFGGSVLLQHRPRAIAAAVSPLALALHLSNWMGLAIALLVYPLQAGDRAASLAASASAALVLVQRGRRSGPIWLHRTDLLVAQALAMAAVLSLGSILNNPPLLLFSLLIESVLFLGLGIWEGDPPIRSTGWWLTAGCALLLSISGLSESQLESRIPAQWQNSLLLMGAALLLAAVSILLQRGKLAVPHPPLLGWLAAALVFIGASLAAPPAWQPGLSLLAMGGCLVLARRYRPPGLLAGSSAAVLLHHSRDWVQLLAKQPWPAMSLTPHLGALTGLAVILIWANRRNLLNRLGFYLFAINIGLGIFLLLNPISPLIVGTSWLILSLICLELANRLRALYTHDILAIGLAYLVCFGFSYGLVINQEPAFIQLGSVWLRGRLLVECFALGVGLYWWFFPAKPKLLQTRLWARIHPWFLEITLLGICITILSEITTLWRPLAWSALALVLLSRNLRHLFTARLQVYSVLIYWIAVCTLVAMLATLSSPATSWLEQPQQIGLLAIGLQWSYIVASHHGLDRSALRNPGGPPMLGWIGKRVANHTHRWLYYPLFAAIAYYLAIRYDRSLLTLLWAVEALAIYVLSAALKDSQFRYLALIALAATVARLLWIDLSQADLGLRGVIFIGVGFVMLGMNAIYNRFWSQLK